MFGFFKKSKESVATFAKRRPIATTMLCLGALGLSLGGLTTGIVLGTKKGDDAFTTPYDESATTVIGEIWKGTYFDPTNFNNLLSAISNGEASSENMTYIETAAMTTLDGAKIAGATAEKMRQNNQEGKEIIVMIDGLNWTPTYLSVDKDGNTILTLWLSDSEQLFEKIISGTSTFSSTGKTIYSYRWDDFVINETYVPGMYGTSYIRSVVLNNGGIYATSATESINYQQDSASAFAKFTIKDISDSLTEYIVTPEKVQWQEYGQNAISQLNRSNSLANENWSDNIPNSGVYMGENYNFAQDSENEYINYTLYGEDNNRWKYDKLWLPSLTETGYDSSHIGIWNTSTKQRQNLVISWLRSGGRSGWHAQEIGGDSLDLNPYVYFNGAVRPAFHLNLTLASQHAHIPTWVDFAADKFANETDDGTIDGSSEETAYEIATAEQLALLAKRVNDPSTHDQYASLYYKQTADIRLGGHAWQPIGSGAYMQFQGHYDGQNYNIEGISAELFSSLVDSYVTNTIIASGFIKDAYAAAGIAYASTRSTLTNCKNYASIEGQYYAGGIICMFDIGTIKNCVNYGNVVATGDGLSGNANYAFAGGIAGTSNGGGQTSIIENCINYGDVTSEVVGGIAGGLYQAEIRNCISNCSLTAVDSTKDLGFAGGGILGATSDGCKLTNCAVYGYVNVKNFGEYFGCLVGSTNSADIITGCSFNGTCNTDNIKPFYGMPAGTPQMSACYACINSDVKYYSDTDSDWAEHYGLAGSMNDGLPMQRSLFAIASVSPATTQDILAVFSPDDGWKKYEAA